MATPQPDTAINVNVSVGDNVSYPAGAMVWNYVAAANGTTGAISSSSPDIDFVSRAVDGLTSAAGSGWSVFNFHNTLTDALQNGSLQNMNLQNGSSLLNSMPTDWKTKYSQDPESLGSLLENVNNLVGVAHSIWSTPDKYSGQQSNWQGNSNNRGVDSFQNHVIGSIQSNQGTEKDGYADHPDYSGKSGNSEMDALGKIGELGGLYGTAMGSYAAGQSGLAILTGEGAAASSGEAILGSIGGSLVGDTGLLVGEGSLLAGAGEATAVGIGMASGVAELAVAAVGVAVVGYGVYKFLGGSGNIPFLDNVGSKMESAFSFFHP